LHDEWPGLASKFRIGGAATFEVFRGTELTWSLVQMKLSDLHYFDS